jgi:hypothetical protein
LRQINSDRLNTLGRRLDGMATKRTSTKACLAKVTRSPSSGCANLRTKIVQVSNGFRPGFE